MEFKKSLELLQNATPDNIVQQLLAVNTAIHTANQEQILAIHFTLEGIIKGCESGSHAWRQIYTLKQSAIARMAALIAGSSTPKVAYRVFNSVIGYNAEFEKAL